MPITDEEILLLERLLKEDEIDKRRKRLLTIDEKTPLNYKVLKENFDSITYDFDKIVCN